MKQCRLVNSASSEEPQWKLVVPKPLRSRVLYQHHDTPTAGHLGTFKTNRRIAANYYWPRMAQDISHYVRSCEVCQAHKVEQQLPAGLLGTRSVSRPWQYVCSDLIGPLPLSKSQNIFILVVCDMFTKYSLFFPIRTANSKTICHIVENEVFLVFGIPQYFICDNGRQYVSHEFKDLLSSYSVKLQLTANFHPSANPTERTNRVIKTMIASFIRDNQRDWNILLPKFRFALCTAVHEVTGYSPAFLNFSRELSVENTPTADSLEDEVTFDSRTKRADNLNQLQAIQSVIRERLEAAYKKNRNIYNLRRRHVTYEVGDIVWKRNPVLSDAGVYFSSKLAPKYIKCYITKRLSDTRYELRDENHRQVGVWHVSMLKPYYAR